MSFTQYISHPAETDDGEPTLLIGPNGQFSSAGSGHLLTVADQITTSVPDRELHDGSPAQTVARVIGLTHDIAKLTEWAQKHLREQPVQQSDYHQHAIPSAIVTRYCLQQHKKVGEYATKVATVVVARHHNVSAPPKLPSISRNYGRDTLTVQKKYERINDQFQNINTNVPEMADEVISAATDGEGSWDDFYQWHTNQLASNARHGHIWYFAGIGRHTDAAFYADLVQLWSALKFADQTAASGLTDDELEVTRPDVSKLESHINGLERGEGVLADLNNLRNDAQRKINSSINDVVTSDAVGTITLPTGFGKTYAGLSAGLSAADDIGSRLVYVLPYTSILDQTAQDIQNVFDITPYSETFSIHHHLADTYTNLTSAYIDSEIGRSPGALHAESWRSGLTLTTTVQLFESLTAPTARQATRLPALNDAVIVIDEPQTIPEEWWQLVPKLIELLVEVYDATVVLMTATQPGLVKYGSDTLTTTELTADPDKYTSFLADNPRVAYHLHESVRTDCDASTTGYPEAAHRISTETADGDDALAICNTRASARRLYEELVPNRPSHDGVIELGMLLYDYVDETGTLPSVATLRERVYDIAADCDDPTVYSFLSGNIRPADRALLIDTLYADSVSGDTARDPLLESDLSITLISTSLIEAGVDISFDTVFRDFAPVPNIVQSGGRCNRAFKGDVGDVIIWELESPDEGPTPTQLIYGTNGGEDLPLLAVTRNVLNTTATAGIIGEATMVSQTVDVFYERLFNRYDPGDKDLVTALESAKIGDLEKEHMIDDLETYEDVIVCLTAAEQQAFIETQPEVATIKNHPEAQLSADPGPSAECMTIGHSKYYIIDGRSNAYHPVFGVC